MIGLIKKNSLKRAIKKHNHKAVYHSWSKIENILILFESDYIEKNSEIKALISQCRQEGKNVVACCYVDKKHSSYASLENYVIYDKKSLNLLHKPNIEQWPTINEQHFDLVLDLTEHDCEPLIYVLLQVDADLRCGKRREDSKLYDFVIDMEPNPPIAEDDNALIEYCFAIELAQQMIKYLKQIKE